MARCRWTAVGGDSLDQLASACRDSCRQTITWRIGWARPRSLSLGGLQSARAASAAERNALRTEPQADSPEPQTEGRETCPAPPLPFFPPKAAAKNRSRFLWSALNLDTELLEHLFLRDGGKFWVLFTSKKFGYFFSSRRWEVLNTVILSTS